MYKTNFYYKNTFIIDIMYKLHEVTIYNNFYQLYKNQVQIIYIIFLEEIKKTVPIQETCSQIKRKNTGCHHKLRIIVIK